jgi:hypothetical protein
MTDPVATPESPLPYIITTAVQEALDQARALGLTWTIRMATVVTASPLTIVYDGDTIVINAVSMIGTLTPAARVYVLSIPPSGNFITGATRLPVHYIGCNAANVGGVLASSTGAEAAFPSASWNIAEDNMTFGGGRIFRADVELFPQYNDNGIGWATFKIRQGQQTTGGQVLGQFYVQYPAGFANIGASNKQYCYFKNPHIASVTSRLSLTVQLQVGVGTFGIYGGDSVSVLTLVVQDIGAIVDYPSIAAMALPMA